MSEENDPMHMQSTAAPRVSIGMPVYNAEGLLAEALDALLAQTFTDFEVLINDNASTDRTAEICRAYAARDSRIHYERNPENLGAAGNFNRVFDRARGAYFKWFAHDDLLAPGYLAACVAALDADRDAVLAFSDRRMLSPDGIPLECDPCLVTGRPDDEQHYDDISFARLMRVCGSRCPIFVFGLMRRSVAAQTRGMGAYIAADLVYVAEMRLRGRFRRVAGDLFFQRLHAPTPDVMARTRKAGDAAWFDPSRRRRRSARMPELKLLAEMVRAIQGSPLGTLDRLRCHVALSGHIATRSHRWLVLRGKRLRWVVWSLWAAASRACLRTTRITAAPLRCWAFAAGLRRGDGAQLRAAVGRPWWRANPALLAFGAQRLQRRRDPGSTTLLVDWLLGTCPVRRQAAAKAMGPHADRYAAVVGARLGAQALERADGIILAMHAACGAASAADWRNRLAVVAGSGVGDAPVIREVCQARK